MRIEDAGRNSTLLIRSGRCKISPSSCWKRESSARASGSAWIGEAPCRNFATNLCPSSFRKRRWSGGGLMQERQVTGTGIGESGLGARDAAPFSAGPFSQRWKIRPRVSGNRQRVVNPETTDDERSRNVYENKRKLAKCLKMNATFCPTHRPFAKCGGFRHHWALAGVFGVSTMDKRQGVDQRSILQRRCPISLPENDG